MILKGLCQKNLGETTTKQHKNIKIIAQMKYLFNVGSLSHLPCDKLVSRFPTPGLSFRILLSIQFCDEEFLSMHNGDRNSQNLGIVAGNPFHSNFLFNKSETNFSPLLHSHQICTSFLQQHRQSVHLWLLVAVHALLVYARYTSLKRPTVNSKEISNAWVYREKLLAQPS